MIKRSSEEVDIRSTDMGEGSRKWPCVLWGNGDGVGRVRVAEKRRDETRREEKRKEKSERTVKVMMMMMTVMMCTQRL